MLMLAITSSCNIIYYNTRLLIMTQLARKEIFPPIICNNNSNNFLFTSTMTMKIKMTYNTSIFNTIKS